MRRAAFQRQIIGDRRAIGGGVLRIVPHLVEDDEARAEPEGFGNVVRHHEDGHAGLLPDAPAEASACRRGCRGRARRTAHRAAGFSAASSAPGRWRAAAACRRKAAPDSGPCAWARPILSSIASAAASASRRARAEQPRQAPASARRRPAGPGFAAPSDAGTPNSAGRRCRDRASARRERRAVDQDLAARRPLPGRAAGAGRWICRSRTRRRWCRRCRAPRESETRSRIGVPP